MLKHSFQISRTHGFTLVEMLVAVSLFSTVMVISVASLVQISTTVKYVAADRMLTDNLGFILEDMTRHIRFAGDEINGALLECGGGGDCPISSGGSTVISMGPIKGDPNIPMDRVIYDLNFRTDGTGEVRKSVDGGANFVSLTNPSIDITDLRFYVVGSGFHDDRRARVLITLSGMAILPDGTERSVRLQTTVEQRTPDA